MLGGIRLFKKQYFVAISLFLFVAIILADMTNYAEMNTVWDAWVSDIAPPARACFSAALASPAMKVEMIMVSAVSAKSRQ